VATELPDCRRLAALRRRTSLRSQHSPAGKRLGGVSFLNYQGRNNRSRLLNLAETIEDTMTHKALMVGAALCGLLLSSHAMAADLPWVKTDGSASHYWRGGVSEYANDVAECRRIAKGPARPKAPEFKSNATDEAAYFRDLARYAASQYLPPGLHVDGVADVTTAETLLAASKRWLRIARGVYLANFEECMLKHSWAPADPDQTMAGAGVP